MTDKLVMVVEDDAATRAIVCRLMRSQGHDTVQCPNGPSAVHRAMIQRPDLVILDLMMPTPGRPGSGGFDGFSVLHWFKSVSDLSNVPIVILSVKPAAQNEEKAIMAGAFAYLEKPLDRGRLLSAAKLALIEEA